MPVACGRSTAIADSTTDQRKIVLLGSGGEGGPNRLFTLCARTHTKSKIVEEKKEVDGKQNSRNGAIDRNVSMGDKNLTFYDH